MNQNAGLLLFTLSFFAAEAAAQNVKIEPNQKYLLLATKKTGTMQKELDEVSEKGFRVLVGSPTSGVEMAIFLERVVSDPTRMNTFRYKLLATSRTGTMQKELNEAATEGFRLLPRTMLAKKDISMFRSDDSEVVVLMERDPTSTKRYEYKLLATSRTGTLQKEVSEAMAAGFTLAGLVSREEHMVIMEREAKN